MFGKTYPNACILLHVCHLVFISSPFAFLLLFPQHTFFPVRNVTHLFTMSYLSMVLQSDSNLLPEVINKVESAGHCYSTSGMVWYKTDQLVLIQALQFYNGPGCLLGRNIYTYTCTYTYTFHTCSSYSRLFDNLFIFDFCLLTVP